MTTLLEALKAAEDALEQNRLHLAGITPDRNTQTAEETQATLDGLFRLTGEALTLIRQAREGDGWQDISTAPKDGKFLCAWPGLLLDDDGNLTDKQNGQWFVGRADRHNGQWDEPDGLNATGSYFDDDFEYAPEPMFWQPLPAAPQSKEQP